jgi:hypothetical protein
MSDDWMQFYYLQPRPERFVDEVRRLAAQGSLADLERAFPIIVFMSCLIAANPSKCRDWFDALSDLSPSDLRSLKAAAELSRVPGAQAYFSVGSTQSGEPGSVADILELPVDHPIILDALWARYFATGDMRAVRRIIEALNYMSDYGAAKAYAQSSKTDDDRARALRDGLFQAASWSLESLIGIHGHLKAFCGELVRSGNLTPTERCALAIILAKLDPATWDVKIDPITGVASVTWTGGSRPPLGN